MSAVEPRVPTSTEEDPIAALEATGSHEMEAVSDGALFTGRVAVMFAAQLVGAAVGILNGILVARLLGPAEKGDYYLLVLVPSTAMVLVYLGLPQAFSFFSARGHTQGITTKAIVLAGALSIVALCATLLLLPVLLDTVLHGLEAAPVLLAFAALPFLLMATFGTGIVMGRQGVRWYATVGIVVPIVTTGLIIVVLGGLGPSVIGAVVVYIAAAIIQAVGFATGARRVSAANRAPSPVSYRQLFGYGLPLYPASLSVYFNYRADVYLIAWLLADPSAPLGYYSIAVALAELVFYFPNAVSTLFFPHVAGSAREDADRRVAMVARVTLLLSAVVAILLVPAAIVLIEVVLPVYEPALPALMILLPGVVALSSGKVIGGYLSGIGRPGTTSIVALVTFVVNIAANLILIPRWGIQGAATASLISYAFSTVLITIIAARSSGNTFAAFWIPRPSDARYLFETTATLLRRFNGRSLCVRPRSRS